MPIFRLLAPVALGIATVWAPVTAPAQDRAAGAYLAGRAASNNSDFRVATLFFRRALAADPGNATLMEYILLGEVAVARFDDVEAIARQIEAVGSVSQVGNIVTLVALIERGKYQEALAELDKGRGVGPLIEGLFRGWALLGAGQMAEAATAFEKVTSTEGVEAFGLYHHALALASVGDFEGADRILSGAAGGPLRATRRGVIAHAQVLSQLDRNPDAVELIDKVFGSELEPAFASLRHRLAAGEPVPFDLVRGPKDGIAEVFYSVAGALSTEAQDPYTLAYSRLAEYLRPDLVDAILLNAALLEDMGQFGLATEAYDRIPRDDPSFFMAELGRAEALKKSGQADAAIEVLRQLGKSHGQLAQVWSTLGDNLRELERYEEAIVAYDSALAQFETESPDQWIIHFTRGIALERQKRWPEAEADFRRALALKADQPHVLNYLGYSYVEKKINLDEALAMIVRAVELRPDDGAITDSLGWAYYRLGRYAESVTRLERAVELMPVDQIVNDHLGDAYWAVGRRLEAEFQWQRALSFERVPDADPDRIRRKLEIGLDAVLKEEGAAPLSVTENGN